VSRDESHRNKVYILVWPDKIKIGKAVNVANRVRRLGRVWGTPDFSRSTSISSDSQDLTWLEQYIGSACRRHKRLPREGRLDGYTEFFSIIGAGEIFSEVDKLAQKIPDLRFEGISQRACKSSRSNWYSQLDAHEKRAIKAKRLKRAQAKARWANTEAIVATKRFMALAYIMAARVRAGEGGCIEISVPLEKSELLQNIWVELERMTLEWNDGISRVGANFCWCWKARQKIMSFTISTKTLESFPREALEVRAMRELLAVIGLARLNS